MLKAERFTQLIAQRGRMNRIQGALKPVNRPIIEAPANIYLDPNGGITSEPSGQPVASLVLEGGDVIVPGPVYLSPDGGLTNEPNGAPIFQAESTA